MGTLFTELEEEGTSHVQWIECVGMARDVVAGRVTCPNGDRVDVSRCVACPSLETLDREWSRWCCATPGVSGG